MSDHSSLAPVLFLFFSLGCHIALASLWEASKRLELRDTGEVPASLTVILASPRNHPVQVASLAKENDLSVQKVGPENSSGKPKNKPGPVMTEAAGEEERIEKPVLQKPMPRPVKQAAVVRKKIAFARQETTENRLPVTPKDLKSAADKLTSTQQQVKIEKQPDKSLAAPLRNQVVQAKLKRFSFTDPMTPAPGYPAIARRRGWQGEVLIALQVAADGSPVQAEIKRSSGHKILDKAALRALSGWRLRPSSKVLETLYIPVRFELK